MLKLIAAVSATLIAGSAFAGASCTKHPKNEWLPEDQAQARIVEMGYKIKKFKVDGNCYEIYGWNKDGKKAEVYFDTKDLSIVKAEIGK
ncbi:PepSY domain-containing protein [Chitinilyticum piscinae]|uniref:PepSY domain-containing protein n=1 Tax=Chitinilyticum piscinae TaxID=2866724 RepID=A0A8J7K115_9NEIS|nr:PepSY domain-containing protein [Chitinilyticum piscinae]MBE9607957.1 PepSY domain-containing protein [Chitinilyticum piscinae]